VSGTEVEEDAAARPKAPRAAGILMRLEYWGFRAVAAVARALPLDTASAVSGWLWRAIAPQLRRHRRARLNLAAAMPELTEAERERILREMWETLGRTFAEAFHLDTLHADRSRIAITIEPALMELMRGGGFVLASLHTGNWEVCGVAARRSGLRIAGVYQSLKNPLVDDFVTSMRAPFYPLGLFSKGHDTVFKLMRILRSGGDVAVLADLRENRGVGVPFFGRPAPSNPFPALMARSQNVPLVAIRVVRLDGAHFEVQGERVPVTRTGDRSADVAATTAALHAIFERWIRERPAQWMWGHRRWG
jgi:KDO2-lipid IV(A) lauroyltransferase